MTVSLPTDKLFKPSYRTDSYGKNSIIVSAMNCWNKTQNMLGGQSLKSLHPTKIKKILTKRCINKNQQFVKTLVENYIRINTS